MKLRQLSQVDDYVWIWDDATPPYVRDGVTVQEAVFSEQLGLMRKRVPLLIKFEDTGTTYWEILEGANII